jgi:ribose transport system substrate-binding protein
VNKKPIFVSLFSVISLVGALSLLPAQASTSTAPGKKLKLAIVYSIVHPFFDPVTRGAQDEIKNGKRNVELYVKAPDKGDVGLQMEIVENLINMGIDGLAIGPSDSKALTPLINKAIEKGIKVVCFDTDAPESKRLGYIGTDNYKAGRVLGEAVGKLNPNAKVICTISVPTQLGLQQRLQGAKDVFKASYPGVTLIDMQSSGGDPAKTLSNIEDMTKTHPDFDVLIGIDAQGGPAAVIAWKALGLKQKVVTFDDLPEIIKGVRDGQITVAITQSEYEWGKSIIEKLSDACNGKPIPANTEIQAIEITKANVNQYYK